MFLLYILVYNFYQRTTCSNGCYRFHPINDDKNWKIKPSKFLSEIYIGTPDTWYIGDIKFSSLVILNDENIGNYRYMVFRFYGYIRDISEKNIDKPKIDQNL